MEGEGNESSDIVYPKFHSCNDTSSTSIDYVYPKVVENSLCALKSTMIIAFGVFTVISNAVLLHLIRTNKTLQTTANLYVVSLAVTDLLVGLVVIPPNIYDVCDLKSPWDSLPWSHGIWVTADFYLTSESILNYVLFNLDRFWSINDPFKYLRKRSRRKTIMHIAASWGIGVVAIISPAITWNFGFGDLEVPSKTVFVEFKQSAWLMLVNAILIYFIPFFVLCAIYGKIFRALSARAKLGVGRTSISSTVFSNKNNSSRRDSGYVTSQPFITECELERLRGIYDRALKREKSERQMKTMFPRRKRRYPSGGELKRYDSIEEEEDDTQEHEEDCPTEGPPKGFPAIKRRQPVIEYLGEKSAMNGLNKDILFKERVADRGNHVRRCNTGDKSRFAKLNEGEENLVEIYSDNSSTVKDLKMSPKSCRHVLNAGSRENVCDTSLVPESCSKGRPRGLKMAKVDQIKKFGGIVCPSCSQMFSRVGLIKLSDLQDDDSVDLSSEIKNSKYVQSTTISISEEDTGEIESHLLAETQMKEDLSHILTPRCIPCVDVPASKEHRVIRRGSLENVREPQGGSALHRNFPERSRRFSHPALLTTMEPPQHRNSIGDITTRVRQSFQNSFSAISGKSSRALNVIRQQEKAAKQLGITLTCLFVCWTPYFLQVIIYSIHPQSANRSFVTASVYLGYFHSLCNPILIVIFNLKIQRAFTTAMWCFPKKKTKGLFASQPSAL